MKCWRIGILSLCTAVLVVACGTTAPTPTPTSSPMPLPPTPTPSLDAVREKLGYALVPDYLPEGFGFSTAEMVTGRVASLAYTDPSHLLSIIYPIPFSPEGYLVQGLATSPKRPDDALSEVEVNGETAYLVRGQWSADTIRQGPGIDPSLAKWDYDITLALFFDFQVSQDNKVSVGIRVLFDPADWTTGEELVRVAESLRRSD